MARRLGCLILCLLVFLPAGALAHGWFDTHHGQRQRDLETWQELWNEELEIGPWFPMHFDVLANKDVTIVNRPQVEFFASEIQALEQYVASGGTLVLINDWNALNRQATNVNELLEAFGAQINNDILLLSESGTGQRINSRMMLGRHDVDVLLEGIEADVTGLWFNDMATLNLDGNWNVRGYLEGEVDRWLVQRGEVTEKLAENEGIIFGARQFGQGVVILFSNQLDWERPAAKRILSSLKDWASETTQPEGLHNPEREAAFTAIFQLQQAVEDVYWDRPTAHSAAMVEQAWTAYIDQDYSKVHELLPAGWDYLEQPFIPLPSRWLIVLLAVLLAVAGYTKDIAPRALARFFPVLALTILVGIVAWLYLSMHSTGQFLDFLARVILLFVAYGLAIITIPMDKGKWVIKVTIFALILSFAYVGDLPDQQILDRVYLQENYINPESAPVQLIAQEIREKTQAGEIENIPLYVESLLNKRLYYREEEVDLHMTPVETLRYMEEDCDGYAILAASILENLGWHAEVVVNDVHAWVETSSMETFRILGPMRYDLYAYDIDGYTRLNITETILRFIRKMYTGPIFFSFLLVYWPTKFDKMFLADIFILFVLSLFIVSVPLRLARLMPYLIHAVFPLYFFSLRLMLGWLKQTYQIKIRVVAGVTVIGSVVFGIFTFISLVAVLWGTGNYILMLAAMLPLLGLIILSSHGYYYNYIDQELKLLKAVLKGQPIDWESEVF